MRYKEIDLKYFMYLRMKYMSKTKVLIIEKNLRNCLK